MISTMQFFIHGVYRIFFVFLFENKYFLWAITNASFTFSCKKGFFVLDPTDLIPLMSFITNLV